MVFLCGGITHASFGGLGIAFWAGFNPILGALLFAVASSLGIEYINRHTHIRKDSAIGLMWGVGMALGALFMSLRPGYTSGDLASYMFGSIITVTQQDIILLAIITTLCVMGAIFFSRPIMYIAFDRSFSTSQGIATRLISYAMSMVVAITIVLAIRIMGIVLLLSLFTIPVVVANSFTKSYTAITFWASTIGVLGAVVGLIVSYNWEVPPGVSIIFSLTIALFGAKLLSLRSKKKQNAIENHT
jgi:zinc transport system permease protein